MQSSGQLVEQAIVGVGLNVEISPEIERDPCVPRAGALCEFIPDSDSLLVGDVFPRLMDALNVAYQEYADGGYPELLDMYRHRAAVIGHHVRVLEDSTESDPPEIARGRVVGFGDDLELYLEGRERPLLRGRLMMEPHGNGNPSD